jgi:hypothetical protein
MNAYAVARQAIESTEPLASTLTLNVREQMAKARVAQWLYSQDENADPARVLAVFNEAMGIVSRHF